MKSPFSLPRQGPSFTASACLLTSVLIPANASSSENDPCRDLLRPVLQRLLQTRLAIESIPFSPHEVLQTGARVRPGERFSRLDNGIHIYLVLEDGNVWTSPRLAANATSEQFLASHRSLLLNATTGISYPGASLRVTAAGEFRIVDGKAIWLSNQSGTFRGDTESLIAAREVLMKRGLLMTESTQLRDLHVQPGWSSAFHLDAENEARLLFKYRERPVLSDLNSLLDRLALKYPAPIPNPQGLAYDIAAVSERYNHWLLSRLESGDPAFDAEYETRWRGSIDVLIGLGKEGLPYALSMVERAPHLEVLLSNGDLQRIVLF